MGGVRLVVVDDHRLLAEALATALGRRGHLVLGVGAPVDTAPELVSGRRPEVCVMGVGDPLEPGAFAALRRISRERPGIAVVVMGPVAEPAGVAAAFAAGAGGYVRHDERVEGVDRAVRLAVAGEAAVAPELLRAAFGRMVRPDAAPAPPDDEAARLLRVLTPREREVLARVVDGEGTRQIAEGMGIALSTARTHVQRVLTKLGARSRLEAAATAARTGLLERMRPAAA
ncbi:helix-turn-helix transcriptional regulator [Mangrovactinospora gilvigrisea]|uniref:Helix-turn-helix transcriptional regulator n=1 Tax=Mangrovactinospora gilvigrisea TaxID=1428644 RepID=A0A1J7BZH3_9ACTN|nr:response regulator transcription factor [Mangrovactinospora gilvigrisea]OIV38881.1 helix-turn-helix transcriptional regulator [Mangrovactinospora gilvigrisea]